MEMTRRPSGSHASSPSPPSALACRHHRAGFRVSRRQSVRARGQLHREFAQFAADSRRCRLLLTCYFIMSYVNTIAMHRAAKSRKAVHLRQKHAPKPDGSCLRAVSILSPSCLDPVSILSRSCLFSEAKPRKTRPFARTGTGNKMLLDGRGFPCNGTVLTHREGDKLLELMIGQPSPDFLPTAPLDNLRLRSGLLRRLREFFHERGFLEVETPILSADTVVDRHLDPFSFTVGSGREQRTMWLQTSPEFA